MLHELTCREADLLYLLFPHLSGLDLDRVEDLDGSVKIVARTGSELVACRDCGTPLARVHDRYRRCLQDLACGGRPVRVELEVRRLICDNPGCPVATFAEQVEGLTARHQRRTAGLRSLLERVALALAGRAGSRLARVLGTVVSRFTLIRLVRAMPDVEIGQVTVLGVDDWAKRRGQSYASVLVDMDSHRIIDILPDREAGTFADWLRAHPGVQLICRDRAGGYLGAREGAPDAQQVADRWHMWDDLGDYVKKTVAAHHGCVREHYAVLEQAAADQAPDPQQTAEQATAVHAENRARVARTRQRYEQVQKLKGEGKRIAAITRELRLAPGTARRYFHADSADELVAASLAGWPSMLDDYKPHLHQRWNEGCTNIQQLHREVKALGFRGSYATVYAYLAPFQGEGRAARRPGTAQGSSHHQLDPPPPRQPRRRRAAQAHAGAGRLPRTWTPCAVTSKNSRRC